MNVYYELAESAIKVRNEGKYFAAYNVRMSEATAGNRYHGLMMFSDRVWLEDGNRVSYLKHRFEYKETAVVDMKEFMWVKLQSREV